MCAINIFEISHGEVEVSEVCGNFLVHDVVLGDGEESLLCCLNGLACALTFGSVP